MHAAGVWLKEVKNGNSFTFISIMQQPPGIDTIKSNTATQVSAFSTLHCRSPQARCCTLYVLDVDSFVPMKGLYDNRALRRNKFLAPFTYFLLFFLSLTPCIVPYSEAFMHTSFYNTMLKSRPRITFLGHFHTLSKRRPVLNNPTSQTKVHFTSAPSLTFEHVSTLKRLQGKPEIADFLQRLASNMPGIESNVELYQSLYPFELDTFQLESLKSLIEGNNILLTTPTGSGKTLVGELAMYYSIMKDMRVIYTTPLKALSNQKYIEFCKKFGGDRVSLTTGDITINKGAPITVMTTEIFRNQLYSSGRKNFDQYSNYHSIGPDDRKWDRHFMVVFDEFHFMNDDERGTVWEESIIACPNDLRILALSATIGNAQLISDWMTSCNGPTKWINSIHRPVPLKYHYAFKNIMIPFFSDPSVGPGAKHHTSKQVVNPGWKLNPVIKKLEKCSSVKLRRGAKGFKTAIGSSGLCPRYTDVARILVENGQLPAIFFIFSRNQCEQAANYIFNSNMCLLEKSDIMEVNLALQNFMRQNPSLPITKDSIKLLHAGIAVHHAGLLPIWKLFIEELFAANKLKVIFATETLAAGINMPARTTVITSVSRKRKGLLSNIRTSELLQMAGRAGRRGIDTEGHVVFMRHEKEYPEMAFRLLISEIDKIKSKFRSSYSITSKMLTMHSLDECKQLVEKSFGSFVWNRQSRSGNDPNTRSLNECESISSDQINQFREVINRYSLSKCSAYGRLVRRIRLKEEELSQMQPQQQPVDGEDEFTNSMVGITELTARLNDMKKSFRAINITVNGDGDTVCAAVTFINQLDNIKEFLEKGKVKFKTESKSISKGTGDESWSRFMNVLNILHNFGAIDQDYQPTALGKIVSSFSAENELWVALMLHSPILEHLDHHQMGALLASVQLDEFRAANCQFHIQPSARIQNVTNSLLPLAEDLLLLQDRLGIDFPVFMSVDVCGIAEAWSRGMAWHHICGCTSMDQGDLHRVFKKTSDLLREISTLPGLHPNVAANAYAAAASFGRYPVSSNEYQVDNFDTFKRTPEEDNLISAVNDDQLENSITGLGVAGPNTTLYLDDIGEDLVMGGGQEVDQFLQNVLLQSIRRFKFIPKSTRQKKR